MICFLAFAFTILADVPTSADVQRAARQVLEDRDIQQELPGDSGYKDWTPPAEDEWRVRDRPADRAREARRGEGDVRTETRRPRREHASDIDGGGDGGPALGNSILWLLLGVAAVVAGVLLARALGGYTRDVRIDVPETKSAPAPARLERPQTEAERLAAAGAYGDAIHVLLLETLTALAGHVPGGLRSSHTSREILRRIELPSDAHPALEGLVGAVEESLFGHHLAVRADYDACVAHFRRFADAYGAAQPVRARA